MKVSRGWAGILITGSLVWVLMSFACQSGVVEVPTTTAGSTPLPLATETMVTATIEPKPTATPVPTPTATAVPTPTASAVPTPTATPVPTPTASAVPTPTATPVPTPTASAVPTPTATPVHTPTPEPIRLAGSGQQVSAKFDLNQGLVIFRMTHSGNGHFSIWLLNAQGNKVDLLVNESGVAFDGSKAVGIAEEGIFILDISADENWSVTIEQPAPLAEEALPITVLGKGQQASEFINLNQGLVIFRMTHSGNGHFSIWLLNARGNKVDLLVNESGVAFDGSKAVGIEEDGVFILDISADENWSVTIEQ